MDQGAQQKVVLLRPGVKRLSRELKQEAAAAEAPRVPPQSHSVTEEIDDDEEEREFLILILCELQFKVKFYCRRYKAWIG